MATSRILVALAPGALALLAPSIGFADTCPLEPTDLVPALCQTSSDPTPCAIEEVRAAGITGAYSARGEKGVVVETTDELGVVTGRTTCISDADGNVIRVEHDTDADEVVDRVVELDYSLTAEGRIESARISTAGTDVASSACSYVWGQTHPVDDDDPFAEPAPIALLGVESVDAHGTVVHAASFDYDLAGRLIARRIDRDGDGTWDGSTYRWSWDGDRLLDEGTDGRTLSYRYDERGRMIERLVTIDGVDPRREVVRYLDGAVETTTLSGVEALHVTVETFDEAGRSASVEVLDGDRVLSSSARRYECPERTTPARIQARLGS